MKFSFEKASFQRVSNATEKSITFSGKDKLTGKVMNVSK